jgi:hypothetical protein
MAPSGELNWQRLTPAKPGTQPKPDDKSKASDSTPGQNNGAAKPEDKAAKPEDKAAKPGDQKDAGKQPQKNDDQAKPMPPAAASGEEAIAQPGALDNLED